MYIWAVFFWKCAFYMLSSRFDPEGWTNAKIILNGLIQLSFKPSASFEKNKKILVDANTGRNKRCCHLFRHSISWKTPVVIFLQGLTFFLLICMVVQCLVNGWRKLRRNVVVESSVFFFFSFLCTRSPHIYRQAAAAAGVLAWLELWRTN